MRKPIPDHLEGALWSRRDIEDWIRERTVGQCPERPLARHLLTPHKKAKQLGVSTLTLTKWRREGTGPAYVALPDGMFRYFDEPMH